MDDDDCDDGGGDLECELTMTAKNMLTTMTAAAPSMVMALTASMLIRVMIAAGRQRK